MLKEFLGNHRKFVYGLSIAVMIILYQVSGLYAGAGDYVMYVLSYAAATIWFLNMLKFFELTREKDG